MPLVNNTIEHYVFENTRSEPALLEMLAKETEEKTTQPQMLTGRVEGRLLKFLVQLSGTKRALELGLFTGYSALCIAEGLPPDGVLITCDIDEESKRIAERYFAQSPHGAKIQIRMGKALDTLQHLDERFDFAFIDADKINYINYYEAVLPKMHEGGIIAIDNMLWAGEVLNPQDEEARTIHRLNQHIAVDNRVENVFLTVRDGIQVVIKK